MGIVLSLSAALCWGVADFFAAFVSRRIGSLRALLVTQGLELVLITVFLTARGTLLVASPQVWLFALGLGVMQCAGIMLLYRAFEVGTLSIVAPLASSFVIFTALFAWLSGERPAPLALAGALLLFIGVALVTQSSKTETTNSSSAGIWLALAAAICISVVFWQYGALARRTATLWPVLPLRICTVAGVAVFFTLTRPPMPRDPLLEEWSSERASPDGKRRPLWPMVIAVTIGNCFAWMSFGAASELASATIVAALSSLFAAVTVFMAWLFLKERLAHVQWAGVAVILLGVLMVSL